MGAKAVADGMVKYVRWLIAVILFPLAWLQADKWARKHSETDEKARLKVGTGMVLGVVFLAAGLFVTTGFHHDNEDAIYGELSNRLSTAVGNEAYKEAVSTGDALNASLLQPNHDLFVQINNSLDDRNEDLAKALIDQRGSIDYPDLDKKADQAFLLKDDAVADLGSFMAWFVYPGLVGAFYAPLVFALGKVFKNAWEPSSSVGYKPYPGTAASVFLLLGAFGVPAVLFAAWVWKDLDERSEAGQISL